MSKWRAELSDPEAVSITEKLNRKPSAACGRPVSLFLGRKRTAVLKGSALPPSEQEYFADSSQRHKIKSRFTLRRTLVAGANIAGFKRVAEAMMEQGVF